MRVLATHSIRQFPLHFPSRASPCATRFRTSSTKNNLLRKIFESKGDEVTDSWYVLHKDKRLCLYTTAIIVTIIKSTRLSFAGQEPRLGRHFDRKSLGKCLFGRRKNCMRIILKCLMTRYNTRKADSRYFCPQCKTKFDGQTQVCSPELPVQIEACNTAQNTAS